MGACVYCSANNEERSCTSLDVYLLLCTYDHAYIILACDGVCAEGEARLGWVNASAPAVYANEGPSSHFSITRDPVNGCLLAEGLAPCWLQVIVCCKHATKLQDCAGPHQWS